MAEPSSKSESESKGESGKESGASGASGAASAEAAAEAAASASKEPVIQRDEPAEGKGEEQSGEAASGESKEQKEEAEKTEDAPTAPTESQPDAAKEALPKEPLPGAKAGTEAAPPKKEKEKEKTHKTLWGFRRSDYCYCALLYVILYGLTSLFFAGSFILFYKVRPVMDPVLNASDTLPTLSVNKSFLRGFPGLSVVPRTQNGSGLLVSAAPGSLHAFRCGHPNYRHVVSLNNWAHCPLASAIANASLFHACACDGGECDFGYADGAHPCVFVKLNKAYDWKPDPAAVLERESKGGKGAGYSLRLNCTCDKNGDKDLCAPDATAVYPADGYLVSAKAELNNGPYVFALFLKTNLTQLAARKKAKMEAMFICNLVVFNGTNSALYPNKDGDWELPANDTAAQIKFVVSAAPAPALLPAIAAFAAFALCHAMLGML